MVPAPTLGTGQCSGQARGAASGDWAQPITVCMILVRGLSHSGSWLLHLDKSSYRQDIKRE